MRALLSMNDEEAADWHWSYVSGLFPRHRKAMAKIPAAAAAKQRGDDMKITMQQLELAERVALATREPAPPRGSQYAPTPPNMHAAILAYRSTPGLKIATKPNADLTPRERMQAALARLHR